MRGTWVAGIDAADGATGEMLNAALRALAFFSPSSIELPPLDGGDAIRLGPAQSLSQVHNLTIIREYLYLLGGHLRA